MKISVALCTYNGSKFLEQQINSILDQTKHVDEIVVCDDLSVDNTVMILNKYKEKYPSVFQIHLNKKNLRSNKNFEKAISLCTGDYIFLADQDDIWKQNKVTEILDVFKINQGAEGVFSNAELIDENNNLIYKDNSISLWDRFSFFESLLDKPIDLHNYLIFKSNFLTGATLCIKKEVKEFIFPFLTTEKKFLHDEWLALVLSKRKTLYYTTEKLISYRLHSQQQVGIGKSKKVKKIISKLPRTTALLLKISNPKGFNDYKAISKTLHRQYIKYKELNEKNLNNDFIKDIEEKLLKLYIDADLNMKKSNPILYIYRKWIDKKRGKRQINN